MKRFALPLAALACAAPAWALDAQEDANAALVQRYVRLMFEEHDIDAAAALLADGFVSHHQPRESKAEMLARFKRQRGDAAADANAPHQAPRRVTVQGDRVFFQLLAPQRPDRPGDRPTLFFELYRIAGGRIAEHWDATSAADADDQP